MNKKLTFSMVFCGIVLMMVPDIIHAQYGVRRRERRRTAVVVSSSANKQAEASAAAASQQVAAANQEAAAAEKEAADAKQQLATAEGMLPIGTVAAKLPAGCESIVVDNVEYSHCGLNYYRAVFQGNNLVYVTVASPSGSPPPD